jgi:hypothetical protein
MKGMAMDVILVGDELLTITAKKKGPRSIEAKVLSELRLERARDRQQFAFRCGGLWFVGAVPDARTERAMVEAAHAVEEQKHWVSAC